MAVMWDRRQTKSQRQAQVVLPILIQYAGHKKTLTYGELAGKVEGAHPYALQWALGCIGTSLLAVGREWGESIPPLQALVVNQDMGVPGGGFAEFLGIRPDDYRNMDKGKRSALIAETHNAIYKYRKWRRVEKTIRQRIPHPSEIPVGRYADPVGESRGTGWDGEAPPMRVDLEDEYDYRLGQACIQEIREGRIKLIPAEKVAMFLRQLDE